jgi:hypothetical protein
MNENGAGEVFEKFRWCEYWQGNKIVVSLFVATTRTLFVDFILDILDLYSSFNCFNSICLLARV